MSTKQTLNVVTEGTSGAQSYTLPDGTAYDPTDPPGNLNAVTMILRSRQGAQRFKDYDPINPTHTPTTTGL